MAEVATDFDMVGAQEREDIIACIHEAFKGVSREGGISWGATFGIDLVRQVEYPDHKPFHDREKSWHELVDDPVWDYFPSVGGWGCLDPVGFRYYIAPTMVRNLKDNWSAMDVQLTVDPDFHPEFFSEHFSILNHEQGLCVARFVLYNAQKQSNVGGQDYSGTWLKAYTSFWNRFFEQF